MKKRISSVIHIWIALFFTLSTTLPASVASASPLSSADESTVQRSEPDENPSGSSDPYAIEPETGFEVVQNADPYLMSLALGNEEPVSQYGPARNDPDQGIPAHAYSPFDDVEKREVCPPGGCDYIADRVLIKFDAKQAFVKVGTTDIAPKDIVLANALDEAGILSIKPLFPSAETPAVDAKIQTVDGELIPEPDLTRWYEALTQSESDLGAVIEQLQSTDGITVAEPDFIRKPIGGAREPQSSLPSAITASTQALPGSTTDPLYDQQWHLGATHVPEAWAYLESQGLPAGGSRDIIVAVIDTGVDYTHPDLAANIWVNPAEFNGVTGVDDDGNGYVDDIHGADTVYPDGNPMDDHGHGTHVAGIIAAQANNGIGGVGVAYNVQVMPIKAAQYSGVLASSDIAEAIYYAVAKGADVINMSFGGYARSNVEEDALAVAFGQAVLVAAAGNDGKENIPCLSGIDMYPAAYNWVLGIMASNSGNVLAPFSNSDCVAHDSHEYELMAPGVSIWSTLPDSQYAAWSGTSMSAPVVSGVAALARTKWADKDVYSSRFIMGQIASNTNQGVGGVTNALSALTIPPRPELSYLEHWLFDTPDINPINDSDGIVDAGETIDLAIVIRNHWGKAENVTVTLEARADGAVFPDPYVTMINDTVNYGAVGAFNWDDNGLLYELDGAIVGVQNPFRFSVDSNTPNDHVISFKLTINADNGYDLEDPNTPYTYVTYFYCMVQKGRELPSIISEDMTLSNEYIWIIPNNTLIPIGITVTVEEGTEIQFGTATENAYLQVEGSINVNGTHNNPVVMYGSKINPNYNVAIVNFGTTNISYAQIANPQLGKISSPFPLRGQITSIDHGYFITDRLFSNNDNNWVISSLIMQDSIMHKMYGYEYGYMWGLYGEIALDSVLIDSLRAYWGYTPTNPILGHNQFWEGNIAGFSGDVRGSVFLQDNSINNKPIQWKIFNNHVSLVNNNAFLSKIWDPDKSTWMNFTVDPNTSREIVHVFENNYFGTNSVSTIDQMVYDNRDYFNLAIIDYEPFLTIAPVTAYPFVVDVNISTSIDPDASVVGAEPVTFTVTFNRDMDQTIQPMVSFGPDVPMTDYTVHPINGGWTDARTWAGTFNINPITGDGYQLIRVAGAVAADDPWLVTGDDAGRFRFEIITSGTEAMNLQATGGEGYVDLMWTQTDFELLSGFHLYRSTSLDGTYTRINPSIIPPDVRAYRDTDVLPGQPYFYKFTVVKSDMTESDFSNVATATPLDTIPPVLTHTLLTTAEPGLPLSFTASATDNVGVTGVTLYYRHTGDTTYLSKAMVKTTGSEYYATIEGSLLTSPGIEYYIEATDGISVTRSGRAENPNPVIVVDKPVLTIVTPNSGPTVGGTEVTISGSNFKSGATVTFGGAAASNVIVVSSNQVTCTTPPHIPETVDVRVTNPDTQYGVLLNGFTFFSTAAQVSLPATGGGTGNLVTVPVNAANINGMVAASLTVNFDPAVLTARSAGTGSLTSGWSFASNLTTSGQVRLSMVSPGGGVSGAGTLANIEFEVTGAPGSSSALSISSILLNDGAITVELTPGTFNVDNVYNVSGAVSFWNGGAPVTGTQLSLTGDRVYTAYSGLDGAYTIQGAAIDGYVLAPSKSDGDDGITAYDASFVLQHDVGLTTLSGYAAVAADVNSNGYITSMDAYYILQKAVDLISLPFPGSGVVWKFDPADRSIPLLTGHLSGQNFTAILLGDISGNWSEPGESGSLGKLHDAEAASAILTIPAVTVLPSGTVDVPITLDITDANLYGADLTFTYDPTHVSISNIRLGSLASGWSIASNPGVSGVVKIAMAGANAITTDGELVVFTVTPLGSAGTQSTLALTRGDLNEGAIPSTLNSGSVRISVPVTAQFSATPTSGVAPLSVSFTNLSTGDWTTSSWSFGDSGTSTSNNPTHQYTTAGTYTVSLTVTGPGGTDTETKTGYIQVNTLNVSGKVLYWNAGKVVPNALLTLAGGSTYTDATDSTGAYSIPGVSAGAYTLTPDKDDGVNGITAYDAALVLRHAAGLAPLSGNPAIAADVNRSGQISSLDASYILQKSVGLITGPFPGVADMWLFDPANRSYANLTTSPTNQDFTAILLGDPTGNWSVDGGSMEANANALSAVLTIEATPPDAEGNVIASIYLDPNGTDVYGMDLSLEYDQTHATILNVAKGAIGDNWMVESNTGQPGTLRLGLADTQGLADKAAMVLVEFHLQDLNRSSEFTPLTGSINEGMIPVTMSGTVLGSTGTNDDIDTPISILTVPSEYIQDTSSSTHETGDPSFIACGQVAGLASVWYLFEATEDGEMTLDTMGSNYNTMLGVWRGAPGSLTLVGCNDNALGKVQSQFNFKYTVGVDYYIGVAQKGTAETGGALKLHTTTFQDVNGTHPLWRYVEGFFAKGITTGCAVNPLRYCPDQVVTRGQMAVFLLRAKHVDDVPTYVPTDVEPDTFADPPKAAFMEPWIEQFYAEGYTTGCATNPLRFCPEKSITRGEMAVFLLRAKHGAGYVPDDVNPDPFIDVPVAGKEWMEPWIEQFYTQGYTTGCGGSLAAGNLKYCPEKGAGRAEMATFIDRVFLFPMLP